MARGGVGSAADLDRSRAGPTAPTHISPAGGARGSQPRASRPRREAREPIGFRSVEITRLPDVEPREGRSVAVGTFDGVHLGHREVIRGSDSVLTFDPHPVSVVAPQHAPKLL